MRGEHPSIGIRHSFMSGSSPHARGAQGLLHRQRRHRRIIPACAGSTITPWRTSTRCRDHPRMRGEHHVVEAAQDPDAESSPHARGALVHRVPAQVRDGIIPACAGSTMSGVLYQNATGDHPRMRGEHVLEHPGCLYVTGSSPHARGARLLEVGGGLLDGIIPACAGSTVPTGRAASPTWDHPRMRGEHERGSARRLGAAGSSPHARGALRPRIGSALLQGIIPACAGSTTRRRSRSSITRDHPRMRGEHESTVQKLADMKGSSPHARGAPVGEVAHLVDAGIIPACAGSTSIKVMAASSIGDHPRMRGEHLLG